MFCTKCGAKNDDNASFCVECGTPFSQMNEQPQPENRSAAPEPCAQAQPANQQFPPQYPAAQPYQPVQQFQYGSSAPQQTAASPYQAQTGANLPPVNPPKKKHTARNAVLIACAGLVVVLAAVVLIGRLFFARDFMQTIYGSNKYAKMMEKTAVQNVGNQSVSLLNGVSKDGAALKKNQAYERQQKLSVSFDGSFENYLKNNAGMNTSMMDKVTDYINSLSLQTTYNYNSGKSQLGVKVSDKNGELISAKGFFDSNKKAYLQLPDISDTYFTTTGSALDLNPGTPLRNFVYDQKKMSASVKNLTKVVDTAIDGGTASIDKSSELSVENVDIQAEKVTVTLNGSQVEDLVTNMLDDIKDDDYFYTFLSENYKNMLGTEGSALNDRLGMLSKLDKSSYQDAIKQMEESAKSISDNVEDLSLSMYITAQNTVVGEDIDINLKNDNYGAKEIEISMASKNKGKGYSRALALYTDGKEGFYITQDAASSQNGSVVIAAKDSSTKQTFGLRVDYSGAKKGEFMGAPEFLGQYKFSLEDPQGVLKSYLSNYGYDYGMQSVLKNISGSTIVVSNSLSGGKLETMVDLDAQGIGELKINQTTAEKSSGAVTIPDVQSDKSIDISQTGGGNNSQQLSDYGKSALQYVSNVMDKHSDLSNLLSDAGLTKSTIEEMLQYYGNYGTSQYDYGTDYSY